MTASSARLACQHRGIPPFPIVMWTGDTRPTSQYCGAEAICLGSGYSKYLQINVFAEKLILFLYEVPILIN